ncbi:hypothetical protein AJ79_04429 [Helicocarpus griseus UAMH5409]|uniref:Uncharacterized protein n=1 Tax=Helicocarpus griseus UAMH5409 TaxID=1447875 RepID=A0A2B7XTF8_9EURO|nr:hypothetical protein AJ79_04429 [Helicocarpus griseus UAMH5409]
MKLSALALTAFVAATNAASCRYWFPTILTHRYEAGADGVDDIPGICGGLWDNLNRFPACASSSQTSCGQGSNGPGHLHWEFTVTIYCNPGMVESAWWEATRNRFGAITCPAR